MVKCIFLEKDEGWCMNRDVNMYLDYPSEHYCENCVFRKEEDDEGISTDKEQ